MAIAREYLPRDGFKMAEISGPEPEEEDAKAN